MQIGFALPKDRSGSGVRIILRQRVPLTKELASTLENIDGITVEPVSDELYSIALALDVMAVSEDFKILQTWLRRVHEHGLINRELESEVPWI